MHLCINHLSPVTRDLETRWTCNACGEWYTEQEGQELLMLAWHYFDNELPEARAARMERESAETRAEEAEFAQRWPVTHGAPEFWASDLMNGDAQRDAGTDARFDGRRPARRGVQGETRGSGQKREAA